MEAWRKAEEQKLRCTKEPYVDDAGAQIMYVRPRFCFLRFLSLNH
jgi:hypothetical protein